MHACIHMCTCTHTHTHKEAYSHVSVELQFREMWLAEWSLNWPYSTQAPPSFLLAYRKEEAIYHKHFNLMETLKGRVRSLTLKLWHRVPKLSQHMHYHWWEEELQYVSWTAPTSTRENGSIILKRLCSRRVSERASKCDWWAWEGRRGTINLTSTHSWEETGRRKWAMATSYLKTYVHAVEPLLTDIPQQRTPTIYRQFWKSSTDFNSGHPATLHNGHFSHSQLYANNTKQPQFSGHSSTFFARLSTLRCWSWQLDVRLLLIILASN